MYHKDEEIVALLEVSLLLLKELSINHVRVSEEFIVANFDFYFH